MEVVEVEAGVYIELCLGKKWPNNMLGEKND
jgi:hypothetical protein